jgi:hypothetical protein
MTVGPGDALFGQDGTGADATGPEPADGVGPLPGFDLPVVRLPRIDADGEIVGLDELEQDLEASAAVASGPVAAGPVLESDAPPADGDGSESSGAGPGQEQAPAVSGEPPDGEASEQERPARPGLLGEPDEGAGRAPELLSEDPWPGDPDRPMIGEPGPGTAAVAVAGPEPSITPSAAAGSPPPAAPRWQAPDNGPPAAEGPRSPAPDQGPAPGSAAGSAPERRSATAAQYGWRSEAWSSGAGGRAPASWPSSTSSAPEPPAAFAGAPGGAGLPSPRSVYAPRPRVVDEPAILGLSRHSRSRLGSRLFTWFFVLVFSVILIQMVVALLDP